MILVNVVMIRYSQGWIRQVGGHESPVLRVPEWLFQVSVPLGCALVILYCLFNVFLIIRNGDAGVEGRRC